MSYKSDIAALSPEQKDKILDDLFTCIRQGRLLDACNGWDKAGTLADGTPIYRPRQMGAFGVYHDHVSDAHPPSWLCLPDGFREET